ncbi:MAG: hypothetical protein ACKOWE_02885 [Micrococcales bacterium]
MKSLKIAAVAIVAALTLQGCALLYPHWGETGLPTESASASDTPSESATPSETPSPTEPALNKVTVEVTDFYIDAQAGVFDVIAEVTDVFEEGGTCALTVSSGASSANATAKAGQNVTDTQCGLLEVPLSGLESGDASFRVSYISPTSKGRSELLTVTIP